MICHREKRSGPEHSEGIHEIATGFALATTFGRIATPFGLAMTMGNVKILNASVLGKKKLVEVWFVF